MLRVREHVGMELEVPERQSFSLLAAKRGSRRSSDAQPTAKEGTESAAGRCDSLPHSPKDAGDDPEFCVPLSAVAVSALQQ